MPKLKDSTKEAQIRDAALRLVIRTGFNGLKMAEVAKEASIATGTLYIYYADKESLINDLYHKTKQEIAAVVFSSDYQASNFYETFRNMWLGYYAFCFQKPEKMLFVEQFLYSGLIAEHIVRETEALFESLNQFLIAGQEQGIIRTLHVEIIKAHIQGSLHEIVKVLLKNKQQLADGELDQCFDMAWNSIRK